MKKTLTKQAAIETLNKWVTDRWMPFELSDAWLTVRDDIRTSDHCEYCGSFRDAAGQNHFCAKCGCKL